MAPIISTRKPRTRKNHLLTKAALIAVLATLLPQMAARVEALGNEVILDPDPVGWPRILLKNNVLFGEIDFLNPGYWYFGPARELDLFPDTNGGAANLIGANAGILRLNSNAGWQDFIVDSDNNSGGEHGFLWYKNGCCAAGNVQMRLRIDNPTLGNRLQVRGTYEANVAFDVAESFWESEPLQPGELAAVDPERGNAVRRSGGAYDPKVLGIVSSKPGLLLGGTPFSAEDLRTVWGEEVAAEFQRQREQLVEQALGADEALREEADRLWSLETFTASLETPAFAASSAEDHRYSPHLAPGPEALSAAYAERQQQLARTLEDRALARFAEEHFASVALSGRVAVKADATQGAIYPGDYLTAGPIPGTAMKATRPGEVIGKALEGLASGQGLVTVFVQPEWRGDTSPRIAARDDPADTAARDLEIVELRRRLSRLETLLTKMAPARPTSDAERTTAR